MKRSIAPDFEKLARELLKDAEVYASVTGVNFFKESFEVQGWRDGAFYAWLDRAAGNDGRGILTLTGDLRDSIRVLESSPLQITFGSSSPKAYIHNYGGTISVKVTDRSRKFLWYMFKATGDARWKWMALTKKSTMTIRIPQRRFMGQSKDLMADLNNWFLSQVNTRLKQL